MAWISRSPAYCLFSRSERQLTTTVPCMLLRRKYSVKSDSDQLIETSEAAKGDVQYVRVLKDFATAREETSVVKSLAKTFRGKKYHYDHWDGAILGFRETEKGQWTDECQPLIDRLKEQTKNAVSGKDLEVLEDIHVLDLAEDGEIKPHIDSVKFCGEVIAGVSLLSTSVMKLQHETDPDKWINICLPRLSLYCLTGEVRFKYTHAIPKDDKSSFMGRKIRRERRVSLICRTIPSTQH